MPCKKIPRGRPNTTVRHSILDYNKTILSLVLINMIILKFEWI